jgi:two-component system KDP operon response regulator KdpE
MNGIEVLRTLRDRGVTTPVVVLTAQDALESKVQALRSGADDYVTKPFAVGELLARVRAQLRRARAEAPGRPLQFAGLVIDGERRRVWEQGREVKLTPTEFALLAELARHAGRPLTLRALVASVWGGAPGTSADTVRVHVGALRRKLEPDSANPRYIVTEPWVGYRFIGEPP